MGWFKHLRKAFKKVGNSITHPAATIRKIDKGIKSAEKAVVKVASKVEKVGEKTIHEARNITHFIAKNAQVIDTIIDVAATAADGVAVAVGQPELITGIETLRGISKKAVDATEKADKAINTAEKFVHIAKAIAHKEQAGTILRQTADAFSDAATLSGNKQLQHVANQLNKGAVIADKVIDHSKSLHELGKAGVKAIKDKDVVGIVKVGANVVKQSQQIKKDVKSMKQHKAPPHPGSGSVSTKPKPKPTKATKEPKEKKTKGKRKPSKYNLFVAEKRKQGMDMKSIGAAWQAQKLKKD